MSKRNHVVVSLLLASSLWGCGPEAMAEPVEGSEPGAEQEAALATQTQELISAGEFSWDQTKISATAMGSAYDRVCFLSRMTGNFAGGGESIHAFTSGSSWYLGGSSMQAGVGASAQCAYLPYSSYYSGEYYWSQHTTPNYPIYMGSATNRVCFLTGVSGAFRGWGEWVHVYVSGGSWYLSGNSQQAGVAARARCVTVDSYSGEYSWNQNWYATYLSPAPGKTCALTYVQGHFRGGGESVNIFQSGGSWYLGGSSMQHDVAAKARCF